MAESVDEGFPQGFEGEQGFVGALEDTRLYPASDRQVPPEEKESFFQEAKAVTEDLVLVEELRLIRTLEAGHS